MQLSALSGSDHSTALPARVGAAGPAQRPESMAAVAAGPAPATPPASHFSLPRPGAGVVPPQFNQNVANAQHALSFLDELSGQLQQLKGQISRQLTGSAPTTSALDGAHRRLAQLWAARPERSGYRLDSQLAYSPEAPARQRFRLRGLDSRTLAAASAETVAFSLTGTQRQAMGVRLDPDLPPEAQARRLDQALAPAGIRAHTSRQGDVEFSVAETEWPRVRDQLSVKGEGKRFPTGQFVRARTEPETPLLAPEHWQLDTPEGLRQALPQIMRAEQQGQHSRSVIERSLAAAGQALDRSAAAQGAPAAQRFADSFTEQTAEANYPLLATLSPSLLGLPRPRIDRLLALG